jgi:hypothetical protein
MHPDPSFKEIPNLKREIDILVVQTQNGDLGDLGGQVQMSFSDQDRSKSSPDPLTSSQRRDLKRQKWVQVMLFNPGPFNLRPTFFTFEEGNLMSTVSARESG